MIDGKKKMKIGIVGAGIVAKAIAKLAVQAQHEVMLCNSRGPQTLFSLPAYFPCQIGTVEEAVDFGEIIILALPFFAYDRLNKDIFTDKIIIDVTNYYPDRDGEFPNLRNRSVTSTEVIAQFLENDHVVKAFNSIKMKDFEDHSFPVDPLQRLALPIAGNNATDKAIVAQLLADIGYDSVDAGDLAQGWRFERGMSIYCQLMNKTQLEKSLPDLVKLPV